MTPADYVNVVVIPTVREHFANKTDYRLGVLACIVTFHIGDHIATADSTPGNTGRVCEKMRTRCREQFNILQGVCHGTKHGVTKSHMKHQHRAGDEVVIPGFTWGRNAWGHAAWGGAALAVEHDGKLWTFGQCIGAVLTTFGELYPQHFPDGALGADVISTAVQNR